MESKDYRPQYDDTVQEILLDDPAGRDPVNIRPMYCLMPASARILATLFSPPPAIYLDNPWKQSPGSPFVFNHPVPWFKFQDGTIRNAALIAGYWGMAGVPYADAMKYAMIDVQTPVEGQ